jgi:hypothetical protein
MPPVPIAGIPSIRALPMPASGNGTADGSPPGPAAAWTGTTPSGQRHPAPETEADGTRRPPTVTYIVNMNRRYARGNTCRLNLLFIVPIWVFCASVATGRRGGVAGGEVVAPAQLIRPWRKARRTGH